MVNPQETLVVARTGGAAHTYADAAVLGPNAVVVLDGSTALEPVGVDPGTYASTLGRRIVAELAHDPAAPIADAVATAIGKTARRLGLRPGASPSSTVAVLRTSEDAVDLYVLGDSPIHYGADGTHELLTDERPSAVARPQRAHYIDRLRAGHGFDDAHRDALVALRRAQRALRNRPDGYWIAEANPDAAHHGITRSVPRDQLTWAVLATDGAADVIDHRGPAWPAIAGYDRDRLNALLDELHRWESDADPDGRTLPRAARHDDKTLAALAVT